VKAPPLLLPCGRSLPLHPDGAQIDEWVIALRDLGAHAIVAALTVAATYLLGRSCWLTGWA